ncbi:zwei Ig domain protein zig-8-like [Bradysia coprophila]|uniref:zwei Ig domain protein zig-8-like n=1 Tax=Bradysia coprophila TaxID=38358 RepID=UPI00187D75EE|nr:zwei Ig domain protein zig-8-like [Bradysia coprophila]XP_037038793.1 zwei Ig domain protein zig-8-like [Bradysia coprophila]
MMYKTDGLSFLIFLISLQSFYEMKLAEGADDQKNYHNMSLHPYFDFDVPRNVTARVGQTAFLHCRVEQLGDKSVSWIRKRDLHILTAGILTYTSDERFQVIRPENSDNWTLQIKFAQIRDAGVYECQVNVEPKLSMAFRLNVVEAKAAIQGPPDYYVKIGSSVNLDCAVSQGPHELGSIFWHKGSVVLDARHPNDAIYDQPNRVYIDTERTDILRSRLRIVDAKLSDSGNYSCHYSTATEGDSVMVHVINGEHPAAMQRGCASNIEFPILVCICSSLTIILHSLDSIYTIVPLMASIAAKAAISFRQFNKYYQNLR